MVSSFFNKVILLLNQNSIVQPYLCSHLYTVCGYNYASKLSLCWYPGPQNESICLKSFSFVSFSISFGYLSKNILQMSLCFVFTDSQSILSPCLSDFKFSTTPSKSSISSSVQLKTSHKLNFFFVPSSSVGCSDLFWQWPFCNCLPKEHFIISCLLDFLTFYISPNHRRNVQSTEFVLYRHRANACQSVTESCLYQVSGAAFKSFRHCVNLALRSLQNL